MIPYSILMINIKLKTGENIEISVLNLVGNSIIFRVLKSRYSIIDNVEEVIGYFYDESSKLFIKSSPKQFEIKKYESDEIQLNEAELYELSSTEIEFNNCLKMVIREYSKYISLKLENDEITAMEIMNNKTISEEYYESLQEYKEYFLTEKLDKKYLKTNKVKEENKLEIAICLDNRFYIQEFLKKDYEEFLNFYWRDNGLDQTIFSEYRVTHIYIGNQVCPYKLPEIEQIDQIINKCVEISLKPVVVFSTMPEHLIKKYQETINYLNKKQDNIIHQSLEEFDKNKMAIKLEIVINDLGTAKLKNADRLQISLGILLNKRKKDSRKKILFNEKSSLDNMEYIRYLQENFKIKSFSYETCGYNLEINNQNSILHFPQYQMNTSGNCTLRALALYGDRKKQESIKSCGEYCERIQIMYPKGQNIIGIWNSLFGYSLREIENKDLLDNMLGDNVKRLVIRA